VKTYVSFYISLGDTAHLGITLLAAICGENKCTGVKARSNC